MVNLGSFVKVSYKISLYTNYHGRVMRPSLCTLPQSHRHVNCNVDKFVENDVVSLCEWQ